MYLANMYKIIMDKIKNLLSKSCCNPQVLMQGGSPATRTLRVKLKIEESTNPVFVQLLSSMDCGMQQQGQFYASSCGFSLRCNSALLKDLSPSLALTTQGSSLLVQERVPLTSEINKMRSREARNSSKVAELGLEYQFPVPFPSPSFLLWSFITWSWPPVMH